MAKGYDRLDAGLPTIAQATRRLRRSRSYVERKIMEGRIQLHHEGGRAYCVGVDVELLAMELGLPGMGDDPRSVYDSVEEAERPGVPVNGVRDMFLAESKLT